MKKKRVFRLIVAGSRAFDRHEDWIVVEKHLNHITAKLDDVMILSGHARGADRLGEQWAFKHWKTVMMYHPDWNKHGKAAAPIRNSEMVDNADGLVAFWDGNSPGTADVIQKARKKGIQIKVIQFTIPRRGK